MWALWNLSTHFGMDVAVREYRGAIMARLNFLKHQLTQMQAREWSMF